MRPRNIASNCPLTTLPFDAQVNILGLINVLQASVRTGVRKVIFASSLAIFGTPDTLPITMETPRLPESPYGITKMTTEHYLRYWKAPMAWSTLLCATAMCMVHARTLQARRA